MGGSAATKEIQVKMGFSVGTLASTITRKILNEGCDHLWMTVDRWKKWLLIWQALYVIENIIGCIFFLLPAIKLMEIQIHITNANSLEEYQYGLEQNTIQPQQHMISTTRYPSIRTKNSQRIEHHFIFFDSELLSKQ